MGMRTLLKSSIRGSNSSGYEEHYLLGYNATWFHAVISLGLFYTEDGGDMFLKNVDWLSTDCTALYPRWKCSTWSYLDVNAEGQSLPKVNSGVLFARGNNIWEDDEQSNGPTKLMCGV
jgi:hypothetical protein